MQDRLIFLVPPNIEFNDFVNPPKNVSTIKKGNKSFGSIITDIPLGIISLSAYIKEHFPIETSAIDFNVELNKESEFNYTSFKEYFKKFLQNKNNIDFNPTIIGISSLFTPAYQSILDLAELSKEIFPNAILIVGGNLPTSMFREILDDSIFVDAVCFGEGEKPLLEMLKSENKINYFETSNSWATHKKIENEKKTNKRLKLSHNFINDLDEIPFLDYDILDLEGYKLNPTSNRYNVTNVEETNKSNVKILNNYSIPIMTSRGCPFKCTFCASHAAHGRDMRYQSKERVKEDLEKLVQRYGVGGVVIQDDHFMAGKKRPYEIVEVIGKEKLKMFFQNALAIFALDFEFLKLIKKMGVDELVLPVESGSMRVLREEMRKPLKLEKIPVVVENCRKIGIYTDCNIIIGMPGETKKDIEDSREFLKTIYADWFRVFIATPIPGSEMHQTVMDKKYYKIPPIRANYKRAVIETEHLTSEYVQYMTYYMNLELNFVYNSNYRLGNYKTAIESFHNVINVKSDHLFAHYFASKCFEKLGKIDEMIYHYEQVNKIRANTDFWDHYIDEFNLPIKKMHNNKNIQREEMTDRILNI